ncbi:MAG: glycosyltransferase [Thermodesulfobacteriota bacterium]
MLRILFITGATHDPNMINLNHFQRVHFLSRWANLILLASKDSDFSISALPGTRIYRSPYRNKFVRLAYFIYWLWSNGRFLGADIVISEPSLLGVCGSFLKKLTRVKWVVDIWDIPIRCQTHRFLIRAKTSIQRKFFKFLFKQADLFIISILPDYELKYFDLPRAKMLLYKNAVWVDKLQRRNYRERSGEGFRLLCMRSRYSEDCGLDILAAAFREVSGTKNISMTIVGKIPVEIAHQIEALRGIEKVSFHDFVEHDRLLDMIAEASACVIPYRNVPDLAQIYPIKVLEYLALGAVIIASDIGGLKAMITDERNGLLFKAGDPRDLARQINRLYENRKMRDSISENARKLDQEFDCRVKNASILSSLEKLVETELR